MTKPDVLTGPIPSFSEKPCSLHTCTKKQLLNYFENTYGLDEWLFSSLSDEECFYKCPDRLRLPLIFYYCHPASLYINKLMLANLVQERVNEEFETIFEAGVDEMSWDDTENYRMGGSYKWPSVAEVVAYRREVREVVRSVIMETEMVLPITHDSPWWAVWMSIEHERIHLETSSVLIRQMPVSLVSRPIGWKYGPLSTDQPVLRNPMLKQAATEVRLGMDEDYPSWGWDNQYGSAVLGVPSFEASKYMVTNREMLMFVQNGGYEKQEYWSEEGWNWREFREAKHPTFWVCNEGCKSTCGVDLSSYIHCRKQNNCTELNDAEDENNYKLRLMFDEVPLPLDWPVEVNYHEAKAFCAWKGDDRYRLPTEAEQHVLRGLPEFDANDVKTDPIFADGITKLYNVNMAYGSSTPVNLYPKSTSGCHDTFGNVWEWIEDHFNGFPGFRTNEFYDDFSTPCFDGRHTMIMGGSWISTGVEASRFARFSFRRHFIQHAGFRLARTLQPDAYSPAQVVATPIYDLEAKALSVCENDSLANGVVPVRRQSTNVHYTEDTADEVTKLVKQQYIVKTDSLINIFTRVCSLTKEAAAIGHASRVLLVGCGPGRLAFDLSPICDEVVGCDTSARCIYLCNELKSEKKFICDSETDIIIPQGGIDVIDIPKHAKPKNVEFKQLTWIPLELNDFNIVINMMLDRSQNPRAWLLRMNNIVSSHKDGRAIVVSKEWKPEQLRKDFEPNLQLVLVEEYPSDYKGNYTLSVWKARDDNEAA